MKFYAIEWEMGGKRMRVEGWTFDGVMALRNRLIMDGIRAGGATVEINTNAGVIQTNLPGDQWAHWMPCPACRPKEYQAHLDRVSAGAFIRTAPSPAPAPPPKDA